LGDLPAAYHIGRENQNLMEWSCGRGLAATGRGRAAAAVWGVMPPRARPDHTGLARRKKDSKEWSEHA
jgi:hypothetical protein